MAGRHGKTVDDASRPSEKAGALLTRYRQEAGHTRATLSQATGLNLFTVKLYESGSIKNPTVEVFNALHDELSGTGFIGWELLEAYGYKTDCSEDRIAPALVHTLRLLDDEAQDILLQQARRELRRG